MDSVGLAQWCLAKKQCSSGVDRASDFRALVNHLGILPKMPWAGGVVLGGWGMVLPAPTTLSVARPYPCLSDKVCVLVRSVSTLCQRLLSHA